jgi:hypothetical protein
LIRTVIAMFRTRTARPAGFCLPGAAGMCANTGRVDL